MRKVVLTLATLAILAISASAQTADEIVARYIKAIGGMEKIQAINTLRRSGKFNGGGGFEAAILQDNKRLNSVREELMATFTSTILTRTPTFPSSLIPREQCAAPSVNMRLRWETTRKWRVGIYLTRLRVT